jgi:hypothetical protein
LALISSSNSTRNTVGTHASNLPTITTTTQWLEASFTPTKSGHALTKETLCTWFVAPWLHKGESCSRWWPAGAPYCIQEQQLVGVYVGACCMVSVSHFLLEWQWKMVQLAQHGLKLQESNVCASFSHHPDPLKQSYQPNSLLGPSKMRRSWCCVLRSGLRRRWCHWWHRWNSWLSFQESKELM